MNKKIVQVRLLNKIRNKNQEEVRVQDYIIGQPNVTPRNKFSAVTRIGKEYDRQAENICFNIEFENGELLQVYPVPPFEVAYEKVEEHGQENN